MKYWLKRMLAILLAMTLLFTGTLSVAAAAEENTEESGEEEYDAADEEAETEEEEALEALEPLEMDVALAHWGAVVTAEMQKKAFELAAEEESTTIRQLELLDMARIYTFDPVRYLVMNVTDEQAYMLKYMMDVETMGEVAAKLGDMLNKDYAYYADAAHDVVALHELYESDLADEYDFDSAPIGAYVGFFTYNRDLGDHTISHIVVFTGDDESIGSSFVISSEQSALTMDESFVTEYADLLGITGVDIRVYSGTDPAWIMGWSDENPLDEDMYITWASGYSSAAYRYLDIIEYSPEMLELTFEQKEQGKGFLQLCAHGASEYMYHLKEKGLDEARYMSGELLEKLRWKELGADLISRYLSRNNPVSITAYEEDEQPEIIGSEAWDTVGEEIDEFPEDAKVLIVLRRYAEDAIDVMGIDWTLQSVVPIRNMPESMDEVDYIIYCDVTYDGEKYTQGDLQLIYPYNHITVHDAKTGEIVKDLGEVVRKLSGFTTVTSTITYWLPLRLSAWDRMSNMFPVPEIPEEEEEAIEDVIEEEDADEEDSEEEAEEMSDEEETSSEDD